MRRTAAIILVSLGAISACQQTPKKPPMHICSSKSIQSLKKPEELRAVAIECSAIIEAYAEAKARLNRLPPPQPPQVQLQAHAPGAVTEKVMYEADVFFDVFESYPPEIAFQKLEDMLAKLNRTYEVIGVEVTGYADENEFDLKSFDLARRRAQFVADYFKASGLQPYVHFSVKTAQPRHPNTLEGRARDRSVALAIIAYRDRAKPQ
jgi:outer membrane protein OmpA-like peptidoglycan-associated protein